MNADAEDLRDLPTGVSDEEPEESALITRLEIRGLFNRYSYDLDFPVDAVADRLAILYGDNGSGKTTVLRLLWNLLSPADDRNHRDTLRTIPFRSFKACLSNGCVLTAEKSVGPLSITVSQPDGANFTSEWTGTPNEIFEGWDVEDVEESIKEFPEEIQQQAQLYINRARYLQFLTGLEARPIFLADDRNIYSDDIEVPRQVLEQRRVQSMRQAATRGLSQGLITQELQTSLARANDFLLRIAFGGTTSGSANANAVYLEVLRRIARDRRSD